MTPDILAGVAATVIGYLMLFATGINGIRHARLMRLGFDGYAMASIWLWIALTGSLSFAGMLDRTLTHGLPVGILYESGYLHPYTGIRVTQWIGLTVGFLICTGICIRSFVMVGNAKKQTDEQRKILADMYRAMLKVRRVRDGG